MTKALTNAVTQALDEMELVPAAALTLVAGKEDASITPSDKIATEPTRPTVVSRIDQIRKVAPSYVPDMGGHGW